MGQYLVFGGKNALPKQGCDSYLYSETSKDRAKFLASSYWAQNDVDWFQVFDCKACKIIATEADLTRKRRMDNVQYETLWDFRQAMTLDKETYLLLHSRPWLEIKMIVESGRGWQTRFKNYLHKLRGILARVSDDAILIAMQDGTISLENARLISRLSPNHQAEWLNKGIELGTKELAAAIGEYVRRNLTSKTH